MYNLKISISTVPFLFRMLLQLWARAVCQRAVSPSNLTLSSEGSIQISPLKHLQVRIVFPRRRRTFWLDNQATTIYNFSDATAIIITILNTGPESAKWEKSFVEFMQNWTENEKPDFMDVSFYSERSIQDELERSSFGDIHVIGEKKAEKLQFKMMT